ncbi:MAG: alpha/beta hydrolase [Gammaproteobacteria bacterium]|nr:alpha/beta hydrolase [Gammaproteobacteria bacterium]
MRKQLIFLSICFGCMLDSIAHDESAISVAPLPTAASEELRRSIENWPHEKAVAASIPPATEMEWLAKIQDVEERGLSAVEDMLDEYPVDVVSDKISAIDVYRVTPHVVSKRNRKKIFLHLHGGAYVFGGGKGSISEAILIASRVGIPVLSVDYRMPPFSPFPAAVEDVVSVYKKLLESYDARSIAIGGTSAGGGLALAATQQIRDLLLPMPGAVFAGTPWADLTKTGDTLYTNEGLDRILITYDGLLGAAAKLYAGKHNLKNPLVSPIYGEFDLFPPVILFSGTRDLFLSDVARTHRKLRAAGVIAELHVYEGMSHAGYLIATETPESENLFLEVSEFLERHLE